MKNSSNSRRPGNRSRDGHGRNNQGRSSKATSNRGNPSRGRGNSAKENHARAVEQWMSPTSQTLTSHIPIINKRDRSGKKNSGKNDNSGSGKNGGRNRNTQDRSQRNGTNPQARNRNPGKEGRGGPMQRSAPKSAASAPQGKGQAPTKLFAGLDPFELFCAYHLGIGPAKNYKPSNINEVANRFQKDPGTIKQALQEYGMDAGSLLDRDFDMALAQLDIQVAPEGVDRIELAKSIYQDYLDSPYVKRDWKKILEEDRKENRKIFGY